MAYNGLIEQVQIGSEVYGIASTAFGTCNTTAGVQEKTVNIPGFALQEGVTIHVRFVNVNSATNPTLNVNGTGALEMRQYDSQVMGQTAETTGWQAGAVVSFTYIKIGDNGYWYRDQGYNTNTTYTIKNTYTSTDGNPISGKGVAAALGTLDVSNISGFGQDKTLKTLSETDGKISATFQSIQIAESQVTNLTTHLNAKAPIASPTFTGTVTLPGAPTEDLHAATKKYVDDKTSALTGAMHFIGITSTALADGDTTATLTPKTASPSSLTKTTGFVAGDVVLYSSTAGETEFVWTGSAWEIIGDDDDHKNILKQTIFTAKGQLVYGSGASTGNKYNILAPNTTTTHKVLDMTSSTPAWKQLGIAAGAWPELSVTNTVKFLKTATLKTGTAFTVPNVTGVGSATKAEVEASTGTLKITNGSAPTLGTAFTIPNATGVTTTDGTAVTAVSRNDTNAAWPTISYT